MGQSELGSGISIQVRFLEIQNLYSFLLVNLNLFWSHVCCFMKVDLETLKSATEVLLGRILALLLGFLPFSLEVKDID